MKDPRVDKIIDVLARFTYDYYVRNTHNGITTGSVSEFCLVQMLEEIDKKKYEEVYKEAKDHLKRLKENGFI